MTATPQHRIESELRSFAARLRPPSLASAPDVDVQYAVEELSVGRMLIATRPDGTLLSSAFAADDERLPVLLERLAARVSPRVLRGGNGPSATLRQLEQYLAGRRRSFELDLDLVLASAFQRSVLARLPQLAGYGQTISYGRLAAAIERPRAARAVGAALGANPLCLVLPCHRVLAAGGALSGYAGGPAAKKALLTLERTVSSGA